MAKWNQPAPRFSSLIVSDIQLTSIKPGEGFCGIVLGGNWKGTGCAAKRIHDVLLQDQSPGRAEKLTSTFEAECLTWSKLRHPGVVQIHGVYLEHGSRLPVLVMEKMDTSLQRYLEDNGKKEFPLHFKAFVLRQISQALAYLHSQNPPLVHHDLSPNNVLLNVVSSVSKLTDFGMSRAINPSTIIRKSSIKGTPEFMSPEALQSPPRYNEKLDVFSFGNIILSTITHEWPEPYHLTQYKGDQLIALDEFQSRERYVAMFTAQEKQLFLPTVRQCLENRPDKHPSSAVLVRELRRIESSLPSGIYVAAPIEQLHQQLSAKEEECRQKNEESKGKGKVLGEKDTNLQKKQASHLVHQTAIQETQDTIRALQTEIEQLRRQPAVAQQNQTVAMLRKKNDALRKRLSVVKTQLLTAGKHYQRVKQANRSLTDELEETKEELECCLNDRVEYTQEAHILKLENAHLAARLVDYETLKNKCEAAQLQLFMASTERDHYREKSLELKIKLLQETEAREAADREKRRLFEDYKLLQKACKELKKDKESCALDDQVFQLDDFHTRLSMLQSEVVSLRDEHSVVKIHRDKFGSNLRQFASEHDSLKEQFMSFAKDLFESVQMKMVQSIDEYERLETAQDTVAEHIKAATLQSKTAENELRKMERVAEHYRHKLTDIPYSVGQEMFILVIPNTAENWREFAMYLGVDACTIRTVEAKHDTAEDCCKEIISRWREGAGKVPKTWATILEAMRLCGLTRGAKEIEETLCSE